MAEIKSTRNIANVEIKLFKEQFQKPMKWDYDEIIIEPKDNSRLLEIDGKAHLDYSNKWWGDSGSNGEIYLYQYLLKRHGITTSVASIKYGKLSENYEAGACLFIHRSHLENLPISAKKFWDSTFGISFDKMAEKTGRFMALIMRENLGTPGKTR